MLDKKYFRANPITVEYSKYAQSLTQKPVKAMLTGPVTILNWSFPREDISLKEMAFQIALAIKEEVLDLEASRSNLSIIEALNNNNFITAVGPGVYDIHSPRVPSVEEIIIEINSMLHDIKAEKPWINPDCGLKTRGDKETTLSLKNLVEAAKKVRNILS